MLKDEKVGSYGQVYELSVSTKGGEFSDNLGDC
jgi:hypothetical protein